MCGTRSCTKPATTLELRGIALANAVSQAKCRKMYGKVNPKSVNRTN